jgi:hypothetical protein
VPEITKHCIPIPCAKQEINNKFIVYYKRTADCPLPFNNSHPGQPSGSGKEKNQKRTHSAKPGSGARQFYSLNCYRLKVKNSGIQKGFAGNILNFAAARLFFQTFTRP